jgi:hypothetical protein
MSAPAEPRSNTTPLTFSYYVYVEDRPRVLRPSRTTAVITHSTYQEMGGKIHAVIRDRLGLRGDIEVYAHPETGWFMETDMTHIKADSYASIRPTGDTLTVMIDCKSHGDAGAFLSSAEDLHERLLALERHC